VVPRLVGHEWPSVRLVRWHFNTVLAGIAIYVIALTWSGVAQGLALLDARLPFQVSVERSIPGLYGRSLGGLILTVGHLIFAYHFWLMVRMPRGATRRTLPPFHEAQPILYTAEADAARRGAPAPAGASAQRRAEGTA
jgi:cytochrome c oxidase cbb3-type subunit 1